MAACLLQAHRNHAFHKRGKFSGCLNRLLCARLDDAARNLIRKAVLAVDADDAGEFRLALLVHKIRRRPCAAPVHPHVERRILHIAESPLRVVQLVRRDSEIQINAVRARYAEVVEHRRQIHIVVADNGHLVPERFQPLSGRLDGIRILVYADQPSAFPEFCGDQRRVAAAAERPVHIDTVRSDVQAVNGLPREH